MQTSSPLPAPRLAWLLFGAAAAGELLAMLLPAAPPALHYACKPLLLLSLLLVYARASARPAPAVLAALALSWLGDVLLLFQSEAQPLFFVGGLLAFLGAHLAYLVAYRGHQWPGPRSGRHWWLAGPVVGAGVALLAVLYAHLGPLRLPVLVYAAVLVLMVLGALGRTGRTTGPSAWWVTAGAGLFLLSDSLLALNKFLTPLPLAGFWIMLTYCAAQASIVRGLLAHETAARARSGAPAGRSRRPVA
ncbi:lysoplasmalogenase [Hymenobacter sp. 15J16-1T3B]|uniref:lysoplasmalogenase n=1 Tax=Hymenobacter sp. 15J16-1T3B TaxID=2886941 RepID=UPI001D1202AF|nr:lysoplasmalogenase [Hymenobacter sp. 15J16-1T3B]MCC3156575.1 lysoplasmalogenase [Hymenobacter sp. 15J16-1T3B]